MPCPAKYSASARVETVMPPGWPGDRQARHVDRLRRLHMRPQRHAMARQRRRHARRYCARRMPRSSTRQASGRSCEPHSQRHPQQFGDPRRRLQAAAGQHQHRGLLRRDRARRPAACRTRRPTCAARRLDIDADARQIERGRADLRPRSASPRRRAFRAACQAPRASRIGCAIAVPSAMVGLISACDRRIAAGKERRGDRPAIRRLGGEDARHGVDLAGAQQFGKADLAAQHVGAGAARRDDVVGRAEAQVLPQLVGQRLGAVQEERMPVVAGVEDRLRARAPRRRRCPAACRESARPWRHARASAPSSPGWWRPAP